VIPIDLKKEAKKKIIAEEIEGKKPASGITLDVLQKVGFTALQKKFSISKEINLRRFYKQFRKLVMKEMGFDPFTLEAKFMLIFFGMIVQLNDLKVDYAGSDLSESMNALAETILDEKEENDRDSSS